MSRYRWAMSAQDKLDALLEGLTPPQQRRLLRHPCWMFRCACGEYGLPYNAFVQVRTDTGDHAELRCQPAAERIE